MEKVFSRAAALGAALASASPASATIVDAIYKGVVTSYCDQLGFFGRSSANRCGGNYAGDPAQLLFEYDTGNIKFGPTASYLVGGAVYGAPTPVLKTIVTINGISYPSFPGTNIGQIWSERAPQFSQFQQGASSEVGNTTTGFIDIAEANIWNWSSVSSIPGTIDIPLIYTPGLGDGSQFNIYLASGQMQFFGPISSVQYAIVSGVTTPELSTWAMMGLGFVGLGFTGYRRAKAV